MSMMRNSYIAMICIFLCRLTGLARQVVITALFGANAVADAFTLAFRIPNLLRDLLAEGALSQSYISVTSKVRKTDGDEAAWQLTNKIATQLTTLLIVIVTLGILFSGPLMDALYEWTNSPSIQMKDTATDLCRIMWPFIFFASLSALAMGTLNIVGVFGLPMLASAAFNIVTIAFGFLFGYLIDPSFGPKALYGLAIAVVMGGAAQWLVQIPRMRKEGFRYKPNWQWKDGNVSRIWKLMVPSVFASGITQFNVLINSAFAQSLQSGSQTSLLNAFQIWQLPVGLFGVATGMVVLPSLSRMMVGEGRSEVATQIAKALRFVAFFAVPSAVVLAILNVEVVSVLFQRGEYTVDATIYTGSILGAYSIGLLGYAGTKIVLPAVLAMEKRWLPLIVSSIALVISLGLNYTFVVVFHKDASWLALTTSVITTFNFLFYFLFLRKQLGGICGKMLASGLLKILLAGLVLALVCYAGKTWLLQGFTDWSFLGRLLMLCCIGGAGAVSYLVAGWILRIPELNEFKNKVLKKVKAD